MRGRRKSTETILYSMMMLSMSIMAFMMMISMTSTTMTATPLELTPIITGNGIKEIVFIFTSHKRNVAVNALLIN